MDGVEESDGHEIEDGTLYSVRLGPFGEPWYPLELTQLLGISAAETPEKTFSVLTLSI